jgi:hypothetical protein
VVPACATLGIQQRSIGDMPPRKRIQHDLHSISTLLLRFAEIRAL